ncbi:uncharacterized protein LOC116393684 isoform X2 [Anarrhichthys ocellatus]|uniref:uncharacterized protein LOC116393684 isoform X2 n=1 Tax=Anarrhichthys ocellatus TaxID=433405 RepID=UPI0012ED35A5|nr:uncharacterized protein LOC116393684 isoform X2 [Anarrhichthys ocellatus]
MVGFRWIQMYFLLLQITEPVAGQLFLYVTVRDGDEVSLPCNSVIDDHENCDSTTWIFSDLGRSPPVVDLVRGGQIVEGAKDKSDRLSVSEKCSLVIKNVTYEDGARYGCRQLRSGRLLGPDAVVHLSVVTSEYLHHDVFKLSCQNNILKHYNNHDYSDEVTLLSLTMSPSSPVTEHEDNDEVTLRCSVWAYEGCEHTVKWLLQGQDVEEDNKDFKTSQSFCSTSLTFLTSHFIYTSRFNSFKCEVKDRDKVQQFSFRNSPSDWWLYVGVALGLAALLIVVVVIVVRCIKTRANQTRVDDKIVLTSNPAQSAPEDRQDPADPEEGVSYASISHPGTNSKAQVRGGEDAVTYSTVNHPSADDNNLYATINQPKK